MNLRIPSRSRVSEWYRKYDLMIAEYSAYLGAGLIASSIYSAEDIEAGIVIGGSSAAWIAVGSLVRRDRLNRLEERMR